MSGNFSSRETTSPGIQQAQQAIDDSAWDEAWPQFASPRAPPPPPPQLAVGKHPDARAKPSPPPSAPLSLQHSIAGLPPPVDGFQGPNGPHQPAGGGHAQGTLAPVVEQLGPRRAPGRLRFRPTPPNSRRPRPGVASHERGPPARPPKTFFDHAQTTRPQLPRKPTSPAGELALRQTTNYQLAAKSFNEAPQKIPR